MLIGSFYTVVKNAPKHSLIGSVQWPKTLRDSSLVAKFDEVDLSGLLIGPADLVKFLKAFHSSKPAGLPFCFFRSLDHVECGKEQL